MSVSELNKCVCVSSVGVVAVLFVLCLKSHYSEAVTTTNRSFAYAKAQAIKKAGGSPGTSSYFRRDPYGPNTYAFGFEVSDNRTGNIQFRDERRYVNGSVEGSFGHVRPDGRVIVTHFLSDNERGFLHETRTFEAGDTQRWQAHWPTKRPVILLQHPQGMPIGAVIYDKNLHLNVTSSKVPEHLANAIKDQHGIEVANASAFVGDDFGNPLIQGIIHGEVPLEVVPGKTDDHIGFESVHDYLPSDFTIVPFELPPTLSTATVPAKGANQTKIIAEKQKKENKYNEAKANNAEKSLKVERLENSTLAANNTKLKVEPKVEVVRIKSKSNPTNQTLPLNAGPNGTWYWQLIDQTRNDFLNNLPDKPEE
uniref:Cuticle protein 6 n=1 Tax=Ceratitis capitata TaxID=7213 RepID=W8BJ98_CERCA